MSVDFLLWILRVLNSHFRVAADRAIVAAAVDVAVDGSAFLEDDGGVAGVRYWLMVIVFLLSDVALIAAAVDIARNGAVTFDGQGNVSTY